MLISLSFHLVTSLIAYADVVIHEYVISAYPGNTDWIIILISFLSVYTSSEWVVHSTEIFLTVN